ncbi:hypothetical protein [Azospirillum sp. TSO22-1]|uniref:hypothetical protein n=1 Tax=Azospirillum sp. TSO22-1 TaxID=716789 RepID=UPI000D650C41|nr:hypothetical protein [Azospirillum sp. TSO22-1]
MRKALLAAAFLALSPAPAAATFIMDPVITFDDRTRDAAVRINNNGAAAMSYRIDVVNLRKDAKGQWVDAGPPQPGDRFVKDYVRFAPRQVTIQPGETQSVRISLRLPANLPTGEYRSHLRVTELPPEPPPAGFRIDVLVNHQLPIIVKKQ